MFKSYAFNAHRGALLGKPDIFPCSTASKSAAGKLEKTWGQIGRWWWWGEISSTNMCTGNSQRQTELAESVASKYLSRETKWEWRQQTSVLVSLKLLLAETFRCCITSSHPHLLASPPLSSNGTANWPNVQIMKVHFCEFPCTALRGSISVTCKKARLNICMGCGKTSVFILDFYPWSPLFISDSYLTHFISCYTSSWLFFSSQEIY